MRNNVIAAVLALVLLASTPVWALAIEDYDQLKLEEDLPASLPVMAVDTSLPAKSAVLMEQGTGNILFEQNADEQLPPASVTKVMTLLLVMESIESGKISLEDTVTASDFAVSMGGSQIWLKSGEQMTVDELLKAVSIASANDASVALAEHVAGSEQAFIQLMNDRAAQLGMVNTTFKNCTGLDEEGHLTTARDIAIMSRELMKYPLVSQYSTVWMDSLRGGATELVNTNKLVRFYEGATGLKTGTTSGAGSCLSATATRGDLSLIAVVMGCPTSDERFASAGSLLDHGFANYMSITPPAIDDQLQPVKVLRGVETSVTVTYDAPGSYVVEKVSQDAITQEITISEDVKAPIEAGQVLGKVEVSVNGEVVGSYNLKAAADVEKMTFGNAFKLLGKSSLRMNNAPVESVPEAEVPLNPATIQIAEDPGEETTTVSLVMDFDYTQVLESCTCENCACNGGTLDVCPCVANSPLRDVDGEVTVTVANPDADWEEYDGELTETVAWSDDSWDDGADDDLVETVAIAENEDEDEDLIETVAWAENEG